MLDKKFSIRKLDETHQKKAFTCGIKVLNDYIQKYAAQDIKRCISVTYILNDEIENKIAGYYSLSSSSLDFSALPDFESKKLPHYQVLPATLLGRLAIDIHYQHAGLGKILLVNALKRSWDLSHEVASFAVVVDAINDSAFAFYKKQEFIPIINNRLYLPMKAIEKIFTVI